MNKHFDIGVSGCWFGANYGSLLNGYSIYQILKSLGLSVLMIQKPGVNENDDWEINKNTHNSKFIKKYYDENDVSESIPYDRLKELNGICDMFLAGSDQIWSYNINRAFKMSFMLNFADDSKKKLSFASSFGHQHDDTPENVRPEVARLLKRFSAISVREQSGAEICKDIFGVNATQIMEPVFDIDEKFYYELAEHSKLNETEPYLLTYILDPTPEKRRAIQYYSKKLGVKAINILDGFHYKWEANNEKLSLPNTLGKIGAEDFLKYYINSSFIITDSFHGTAFSIIFKKPFISIANLGRGLSRFKELLGKTDLLHRFVPDPKAISEDEKLLENVDFTYAHEVISNERDRTLNWIKNAIETPASELPPVIAHNISPDLERCRIIVSLIKSKGIRHVVLCAGTRNISFDRLFEANQDFFKIYYVTDERSAGYFAIGLATKLKETVVICCTSGTAVSNYVPPVTEAFYSKTPLLILTADRYPGLVENQEQQTTVQLGLFDTITKKSFQVPADKNEVMPRKTACIVSEALFEINHHGNGPVHLNVPIFQFDRYYAPKYSLVLPRTRLTKRIEPQNPSDIWRGAVEKLKSYKRILVMVNQQSPPSDELSELFVQFAERYNVVYYADHFANLHNDYTVHHQEIIKVDKNKFSPDLIITFGEERTNITSLFDVMDCKTHWRVNEDGKFCNKFYILDTVFECSSKYFLKYFSDNAGGRNELTYLNLWKEEEKKFFSKIPQDYGMKYIIGSAMSKMPEYSLLHMARSLTVRYAHNFMLPKGVEVFCNAGTNGIDGSASAFMGQAAAASAEQLCFLFIGDLSFFYDINSLWNKRLTGNIRILLNNNGGAGLLRHLNSSGAVHAHATTAAGWVKSLGFEYLSATTKGEFDSLLPRFVSREAEEPIFFEVFLQ